MATINITGTGGIIEGNLGTSDVNVNLDSSLYFDGNVNDDRIVVSDDNTAATGDFGTGNFSISFWIYVGENGFDTSDSWGSLLGKGFTTSAPSNGYGFVRNSSSNNITFLGCANAGGSFPINLSIPSGVVLGAWNHMAFTRNGTSVKLYHQGQLVNSATASETGNFTNTSDFKIGTNNSNAQSVNGSIADVKLFDDELTAAEVQYLSSKVQADPDIGGLDNCESWWKINEGTGTNVVNHKKGSANGTITGAEWQYDKFSVDVYDNSTTTDGTFTVTQGKVEGLSLTSVDLDGSNDYISLGTGLTTFDGATEGTFSAWVKRDGTGSEDSIISHYDSTDSNRQFNFLVNASNQAKLVIQNDKANFNSAHDVAGTTSFASGVWYHMVGTFSTTNGQKIYVNGVLEGTAATTIEDALDTVTTDANIGVLEQGGSLQAHTNGNVKDVRLYTQELSADQVASLYSNTLPITPTNWWKIDDATQTATATIEDYGTGTDVDGTGVSLTWTNGTLDLDGDFTIAANGILSAPRGTLDCKRDFHSSGTYTHNNGTALLGPASGSAVIQNGGSPSEPVFYNLQARRVVVYNNLTVENRFDAGHGDHYCYFYSPTIVTMGTTTSQGTFDIDSATVWFHNSKLYGASSLYPAIVDATNDLLFDSTTTSFFKNIDYQGALTTNGTGHDIQLDGDCEFDAVTIASGDTLDLNGQRAVFGGAFDLTTGALAMNDAMAVFKHTIDFNGRVPTSNTGTTIIHNPPSTSEKLITSLYFGGTFFAQGAESDVNGYAWQGASGSGEYPEKIFVGGELDCQQSVKTITNLQVATGGELRGNDRTITCEGDLTMSGGLIGLSALETVASSSESASTSANYTVLDNLASCTIEFWLKLTDISNTSARILNVNSGTSGEAYYIRTDGSALQFHLGCLTTDANFSNSDTSLLTLSNVGTKWHHYALVKDNNTVSLYIDGKKVAEKTTSGNTQSANSALVIGKYHGASSNYADMVMDELRFYTDVRTTSEIRDNMFTESPSGDALVGHYKFNEGTGTTVADSSSNSNTLTLSDAGAWAGAGTFIRGTSNVKLTGNGSASFAGTSTEFNNLEVASSSKTTTFVSVGGDDKRPVIRGTLTHGGGTLTTSTNCSIDIGTGGTVSSGADTSGLYFTRWNSATAVPALTSKYLGLQTNVDLAGDQTNTQYIQFYNNHNLFDFNITTNRIISYTSSNVTMGAGTIEFTSTIGWGSNVYDNRVFTAGPGATIKGVGAKSGFASGNNWSVVGKIENLDVTNEELKVTGQVINCTGDIHQYFPTIDHSQQLDADTADDRDVRLGRDLDKNTELINS